LILALSFPVTIFSLLSKRGIHEVARHEEGVAEIVKVPTED